MAECEIYALAVQPLRVRASWMCASRGRLFYIFYTSTREQYQRGGVEPPLVRRQLWTTPAVSGADCSVPRQLPPDQAVHNGPLFPPMHPSLLSPGVGYFGQSGLNRTRCSRGHLCTYGT
jgi:hypothetical protein